MLAASGLAPNAADVVIGGPPCQPFSKSGFWVRGDVARMRDPRAQTLVEFMRVIEETLPRAFLLENVHGIAYAGKEDGLLVLSQLIRDINARQGTDYRPSFAVLNTADYGVPQMRKRFFLVAHRGGIRFRFPQPTHTTADTELPLAENARPLRPAATAWDAIGDIEPDAQEDLRMRGRFAGLLPSIPEGENYSWHTSRRGGMPLFGWRTRYWSFLLKLAKARPSWTIQAQPGPAIGPFHWKSRRLSVAEMAALQTFPIDVVFTGSRNSVQRQIGNAVPSLMAEMLARAMAEQFFGVVYPEGPSLAVPSKRPIPPPEPLGGVPEEYHGLVGDHADHPGEGRGSGARRRRETSLDLFD